MNGWNHFQGTFPGKNKDRHSDPNQDRQNNFPGMNRVNNFGGIELHFLLPDNWTKINIQVNLKN